MIQTLLKSQYFRTLSTYKKLSKRFANSIKENRFKKFSDFKKQQIISRLERLKKRLESFATMLKLSGALAVGLTFFSNDATAQVYAGGETLVSSYYMEQLESDVANDDNGNYVITWSNNYEDGSYFGIYARRYNNAGVAQGAQFKVNTYTTGLQYNSKVAMDADGDFVITWASQNQDGNGWGIYAQRYNSLGVAQGSEFLVNTTTNQNQNEPDVAMDDNGNFVITWGSSGQDGNGYGVYARRYSSAGAALSGEFQVNTVTTAAQKVPNVAMDADGDFVIVFSGNYVEGNIFYGIGAQRYNAAGVPQGGQFTVNTYTTNSQKNPSVAMDDNGNFVVAWESYGQDGNREGIYAQRFDNSASMVGSEFQVNTYTTERQNNPRVALHDADGTFLITWDSYGQDASYTDGVYAQRYNAAGAVVGSEFLVNTNTTTIQFHSTAFIHNNGDFVIAYSSRWNGSMSLYSKYFRLRNTSTDISISSTSTDENISPNTIIATLSTTDSDVSNTTFRYKLVAGVGGDDNASFTISGNELKIVSSPNFETKSSYKVRIQSMDEDDLIYEEAFTITINDVNDAPNVNYGANYVAENLALGTSIGTVSASDDEGNTLTYSIVSGNPGNVFAINSSTGEITVTGVLNYEGNSNYFLGIEVSDNGSPSKIGTGTYNVELYDVNDVPVVNPQTFDIDENSSNGTVVGVVAVVDDEPWQGLTYTIVSGNTGNTFNIDGSSGEITLTGAVDFESTSDYTLEVEVTDGQSPTSIGTGTITIEINDLNEEPEVVSETFTVDENSSAGTIVGTVDASDVDDGQTLSYAITSGNTGNAFSINGSTGVITVAGSLDFESTSSYTLSVKVTDDGTPEQTATATITINVNDLTETGINDASTLSSVQMFPNPATGHVEITIEGNALVRVSDLTGTIVKQEILTNGILDVSQLKTGAYTVEIIQGEKRTRRKLIVNH